MAYTFDFIDRDGRVDHFDFGSFATDADAEFAAQRALSDSRTAIGIEVWQGDRKVTRIETHVAIGD